MREAVREVVDAKRVVEWDAGDAIEHAGEVAQVELLSVPRVDSHQLQSLGCFLVDQFVIDQGRGQTGRDVEALSVGEHILNAPLLHQLSVLLDRVHLDSPYFNNCLPKNFLVGYFLRKRFR